MKIEQARQIAAKAIEELGQALEAGHSEKLQKYLAAMARFRKYSWHNTMLIAFQCPNASRVAGFRAWQQFGRSVKKGERGILILAPMVQKARNNDADPELEQSTSLVRFRAAYVFDVSQTDGKELPEIGTMAGDPQKCHVRLEKFVADQGIALAYSDEISPARGLSEGGKITLLPGQSPAEEFETLAHEVAHELMHHAERRAQTTKRIRETEAEAVAYVVCTAIGLETGTAAQDYIGLYAGDAGLLSESLEHIQTCAARILDAICM